MKKKFGRTRLTCSFCGKGEAEVAKLVAGPKVLICDRCVAIASRIMEDPGNASGPSQREPGLLRRLRDLVGLGLSRGRPGSSECRAGVR